MNDTSSETREKLKRFVSELKSQEFPTSTISSELAKFVASALEDYLTGKKRTLEAAFGLSPKMGIPGYPEARKNSARTAIPMRWKKVSWKKIADEVAKKYPSHDQRSIQRHCEEFYDLVEIEELTKRLEESDYHRECAIKTERMIEEKKSLEDILKEFPDETEDSLRRYFEEYITKKIR